MRYVYPATFTPNDDGSYTVIFPDLPGCVSEGKSLENAMYMARDALALWIDTMDELHENINPPSNIADIASENGFVTLIDADTAAYKRQRDNQAVKRTLSLPKWLDSMANEANLSLSKVLQEALCDRLGVSNE